MGVVVMACAFQSLKVLRIHWREWAGLSGPSGVGSLHHKMAFGDCRLLSTRVSKLGGSVCGFKPISPSRPFHPRGVFGEKGACYGSCYGIGRPMIRRILFRPICHPLLTCARSTIQPGSASRLLTLPLKIFCDFIYFPGLQKFQRSFLPPNSTSEQFSTTITMPSTDNTCSSSSSRLHRMLNSPHPTSHLDTIPPLVLLGSQPHTAGGMSGFARHLSAVVGPRAAGHRTIVLPGDRERPASTTVDVGTQLGNTLCRQFPATIRSRRILPRRPRHLRNPS
ncbi:hypothetical protein N657DRAFT_150168 [Parathielavia appendiculata]|uniref:Uncharacterized protein n=1 Tax=Parathielavia appendiculata TaxID=2587402 RepID=A0AAN6TUW6_9PEZI|nr:hypothetical protein N657DRAFT_150168 [Parathielavia appendiculata]